MSSLALLHTPSMEQPLYSSPLEVQLNWFITSLHKNPIVYFFIYTLLSSSIIYHPSSKHPLSSSVHPYLPLPDSSILEFTPL
jgi:hypothetical protein